MRIIAMLAAVFTGSSLMILGQYLVQQLYPAPDGMDFQDVAQQKAYFQSFPNYIFAMMFLSHQIATFVAAFLSARLDPANNKKNALMIGLIFLMGGLMNLQSLPHPAWMWAEIPFYLFTEYNTIEFKIQVNL